jgi:hypothetical protein
MAVRNTQPLSPELLASTDALLWSAKRALASEDRDGAARLAYEAWTLVPEPKYGCDRAYMFMFALMRFARPAGAYDDLIAIVDGYISSGFHSEHEDGPYFWLGTLYFEKGNLMRAFEYFDRAQKMSRGRCFVDEDPRYKRFYTANKPLFGGKPNLKTH